MDPKLRHKQVAGDQQNKETCHAIRAKRDHVRGMAHPILMNFIVCLDNPENGLLDGRRMKICKSRKDTALSKKSDKHYSEIHTIYEIKQFENQIQK
ncbi:hypothetical protein RvY_00363 [Ramazzottius varieornatus]|uniref:Uncharacterized protein n=1 Tax=Ramazzottius varieornatus TaxID=947166 RepID=A0A1D1UMF9_RAMVA|nr:hypothetical protein RvY_00363 [Ramazzottius varieornatus]